MKGLAALLVIAAVAGAGSARADDASPCASPRQMEGFKTCADIAKAEAEGELVVYATDPEAAELRVLAEFTKMFPKIKTNYVRLQAGALFAKILSERQARTYLVDTLQLSDMGMVLDFQKRGGYDRYVSPEMPAYKPEYKSQPEGFWTWGAVGPAGIAYNPTVVPPDQAPKTWEDALDPKWTDSVSVKVSNSGLQHVSWYELKKVVSEDYWTKFAPLKPKAFDSYVQQYDRLVNQQDKIIHTAQYSGYLEWKAKGAPVAFVAPAAGLPATPETWGLVKDGPHPNAARLYMDWFLSPVGQQANSAGLFLNSPRTDVAPPPGGMATGDMKLLLPTDWSVVLATRPAFTREWDHITGLR